MEDELDDLDEDMDYLDDENYNVIFEKLKSEWLLAEIEHSVSKTASEAFWRIGLKYFPKLQTAAARPKKTPQFQSIRNQMHNDLIPPIDLDFAYKHKRTGEVTIVSDTITPMRRFPTSEYEKLYEIGTVEVSQY